jgi:PPOX class probable F420-dependent enzyme
VGLTPEVAALFRRPDVYAFLGTTNDDGSPHVAPLWADADPDRGLILLNTAEGRRKVRNVRRDPRVVVAAIDPAHPSPPALVRGRVEAIVTEGALAHIDALSRRYDGSPWEPVEGQVRLILEIRPDP